MAVVQRLSKVAKELNVGINTIVEFLRSKEIELDVNPNTKVSEDIFDLLKKEFKQDQSVKKASEELIERKLKEKKETISIEEIQKQEDDIIDEEDIISIEPDKIDLRVVGKINLEKTGKAKTKVDEEPVSTIEEESKLIDKKAKAEKKAKKEEPEHISVEIEQAEELKIIGKIDLDKASVKKEEAVKKEKAPSTDKEPVQEKEKKTAAEKKPDTKKPVKPAASKPKKVVSEKEAAVAKEQKETKEKDLTGQPVDFVPTKIEKLSGPTVVGKIELPKDVRNGDSREDRKNRKKKRKRIKKEKERINITTVNEKTTKPSQDQKGRPAAEKQAEKKQVRRRPPKVRKRPARPEVSEEDVAKQIKDTLARLTSKGKSKAARYRRDKRDLISQRQQEEQTRADEEKMTLKVTEFVTANELANLMDIQVNQIIASCMSLGLVVSINQRLDAETISLVTEEFGFKVEFISVDAAESISEQEDRPEDLKDRPAIVTVMGHVDHGKTSLLDYIRKADVTAEEAGGITQHIGAYSVKLDNNKKITFLDTPGHEAFTAMRARGAQITDIVIIIIAANDNVMPQTIEAINHASAAGVPIIFAISKIDVSGANPEKVKESLANINYLVEDWGGKYQSQEISAKHGTNVKQLLEKVLLEAELLELKANPNKPAVGSVIESSLDKGRGFITTLLVQAGTLKLGDLVLAGSYYGNVKAMFNERNQRVESVGPSEPVLILGLNGAPQAGEKFNVMSNERETKEIAAKRFQLQREQGMRAQKHITLDEIGRRIAIGNFQELNLIVKGDVDGSIEALSDSLIKLSTEEIQVNVIHKAVGGIADSDIMLAAASNAIVIGFQVRPSLSARKLAEKEQIDIRLYSIIYDAIEEITAAMEGMLSPEIKEKISSTVDVREVYKISKVGTVAGCMVKEGKIKRNSKVRVIRDGIVIYTGELGSLKRFKDDVKEVASGFECGLNIQNFNDIKVGDIVEAYEEFEVSRKL